MNNKLLTTLAVVIMVSVSMVLLTQVSADPTGATLSYQYNSSKSAASPDSRNNSKGAIHTIRLNSEQQDNKWKAYVGNVSSTFVLDDANDYSIYQWTITSFTGQVYITRNNSTTWGSIECANVTHKVAEDTALGHTTAAADSINSTFTAQAHKTFYVGSTEITQNNCYSIATWVNNTVQTPSSTQPFVEVLLYDGSYVIYTTFVENDLRGYDNSSSFDFQAIIPDDATPSNPPRVYYFYLELLSS